MNVPVPICRSLSYLIVNYRVRPFDVGPGKDDRSFRDGRAPPPASELGPQAASSVGPIPDLKESEHVD